MLNHDQFITYVHTNTGASEMLMANAVQELAAHAVVWLPTIIIVGSQKNPTIAIQFEPPRRGLYTSTRDN